MARGWESKSVEDQIAAAEARPARSQAEEEPTPGERERRSRVANLQLARARALQSLQQACDRRYRALLEQSLADIDAQLARDDNQPPAR